MSIAATEYALAAAEVTPDLSARARVALFALAARANVTTGETFTGTWLAPVLGVHPGRARLYVAELERSGLVGFDHRAGRASVVLFPVGTGAEVIHNPRPVSAGETDESAGGSRPVSAGVAPRERGGRAPSARVSDPVSDHVSACTHRWRSTSGDCPVCLDEQERTG